MSGVQHNGTHGMGRKNKGYRGKKSIYRTEHLPNNLPNTCGVAEMQNNNSGTAGGRWEWAVGINRTHEECRKKEPRKEWESSSKVTKHKLGKFVGLCV